MTAINAEAQAQYEQQKSFNAVSVDTSGMSAEEAEQAVEAYMRDDLGITLESLAAAEQEDYWRQKLYDATVSARLRHRRGGSAKVRRAARRPVAALPQRGRGI